jgi:Tfp pilus assembly protein PilF
MRQQSRDAAAIPSLREIVALAPDNRLAWLQLAEAYRAVGNIAGFCAAHRRAIDGPGSF